LGRKNRLGGENGEVPVHLCDNIISRNGYEAPSSILNSGKIRKVERWAGEKSLEIGCGRYDQPIGRCRRIRIVWDL